MKKEELLSIVDKYAPRIVEIREDIHANPELSSQEFRTSRLVADELQKLGIEVKTWPDYTGVVGLIKGAEDGPVIALRADMDALPILEERTELPFCSRNPGVMHACGHDVHTTVQLGAAAVLKELAPKMKGSVKLIFQPAEEATGMGAGHFISLGCLENPHVDQIFAIHVTDAAEWGHNGTKYGITNSAPDVFSVTVHGVSSHGTRPQKGVDALYTACQMITALYGMTNRRLSALQTVSVNVGKFHSGTASNIIADKAEFDISLRTIEPISRKLMHEEIIHLLKSVAKLNHAEVEINERYGCPSQVNDKDCVDAIVGASDWLYGEGKFSLYDEVSMGSEDFSEYGATGIPSAMWELGVANLEKGWTAPLHNSKFCADERAIPIGMAMQAAIIYSILGQDGLE